MPYEFQGMVTSQLPGCNIYAHIPLLASDSYVYAAATKLMNNTIPGRKVYIELADEPWNSLAISIPLSMISRINGQGDKFWWYVLRLTQIRTIFHTVFGSRANDVQVMVNAQCAKPGTSADM